MNDFIQVVQNKHEISKLIVVISDGRTEQFLPFDFLLRPLVYRFLSLHVRLFACLLACLFVGVCLFNFWLLLWYWFVLRPSPEISTTRCVVVTTPAVHP